MRIFSIIFIILIFYSVSNVYPEQGGKVVSGIYSEGSCVVTGISAEQCQLIALQRARASAIEKSAGVKVSSHTVVSDMKLSADFIRTYSTGYIIKEDVKWELSSYQKDAGTPPIPEYLVKIVADVYVPDKKSSNIHLFADLNKGVFRKGEKASITVKTGKKAKIAIFNITAEDKVIMLFPNVYERENTVEGSFVFPHKNSMIELEMSPLPGHKRDAEALFVSAVSANSQIDFAKLFKPDHPLTLSEFFKRYSEIADYAEDVIISYEVVNE